MKKKYVLIMRPLEQGKSLLRLIRQAGSTAYLVPMIRIIPWHLASKEKMLAEFLSADWVGFTSVNAVKHAGIYLKKRKKSSCRWFAIGAATAKAMQKRGIKVDWTPSNFSSEGLLALPVFRAAIGKRVVLFSGYGGRSYLMEKLQERGARAKKIVCYRRIKAIKNQKRLNKLLPQIQIIVSTSQEILKIFHCLLSRKLQTLAKQRPLIVPSKRIKDFANTLGYEKIYVAASAEDNEILKTLKSVMGGKRR